MRLNRERLKKGLVNICSPVFGLQVLVLDGHLLQLDVEGGDGSTLLDDQGVLVLHLLHKAALQATHGTQLAL